MHSASEHPLRIEPLALCRQFLDHWPPFLAVHAAVALLSASMLLPAAAALLRLAVSLSGESALSDQDILFFVLSPGGFLALLLLGSLFSIIVLLGHAAMLVVALTVRLGQPATARQALVFLARRYTALFELALRILLRVLLNVLPFALAALLLYRLLLSEYDINYYLSAKPVEWRLALAGGGLLAVACAANLLRLLANWLLCLPLLLFTGCSPREALVQSLETMRGHRGAVLAWLSLFVVRLCEALGLQWTRRPAAPGPARARSLLGDRRAVFAILAGGFCTAVLLSWLLLHRLPFATDTQVMAHRAGEGCPPTSPRAGRRRRNPR